MDRETRNDWKGRWRRWIESERKIGKEGSGRTNDGWMRRLMPYWFVMRILCIIIEGLMKDRTL